MKQARGKEAYLRQVSRGKWKPHYVPFVVSAFRLARFYNARPEVAPQLSPMRLQFTPRSPRSPSLQDTWQGWYFFPMLSRICVESVSPIATRFLSVWWNAQGIVSLTPIGCLSVLAFLLLIAFFVPGQGHP